MQILPIHQVMHVLSWLEGTWITDGPGNVTYPSMKPIMYYDQINITSIGQPMFNYIAQSWLHGSEMLTHRETGFLQILPNSKTVVLSLIDNLGLFTVELGSLSDDSKSFDIESTDVLVTVASVKPFSSMTQVQSCSPSRLQSRIIRSS